MEVLQLWGLNSDKKGWDKLCVPKGGHSATVCCVDWAPLMGRRNHIIASSSYDGNVMIWKISINEHDRGGDIMVLESTLSGHEGPVWRVCWDLLGTCLSSAGEDKTVRVWRRNLKREWIEAANSS
jgi:WD40 repeat protein